MSKKMFQIVIQAGDLIGRCVHEGKDAIEAADEMQNYLDGGGWEEAGLEFDGMDPSKSEDRDLIDDSMMGYDVISINEMVEKPVVAPILPAPMPKIPRLAFYLLLAYALILTMASLLHRH